MTLHLDLVIFEASPTIRDRAFFCNLAHISGKTDVYENVMIDVCLDSGFALVEVSCYDMLLISSDKCVCVMSNDIVCCWCQAGKKDSTAMAFPSSEAVRQIKHVVMAPPGTRPKAVGANKTKKKPNVVRIVCC